jgi:hypothetical protein
MKITSAQAAKMIRQLNDELSAVQSKEEMSKSFLASLGEDVESVRPKYDYETTQELIITLETRIRKLKHAINVFNSTQIIPEYGFTIDEMLVYLPQITKRLSKLSQMKNVMPKAREKSYLHSNSTIIDYRYANYDIEKVTQDYTALYEELSKAQTALDYVNSTVEFEFEF